MARTTAPSSANGARRGFLQTLAAISNQQASGVFNSPGLRIDGGSGAAVAEAQNATYGIAAGTLFTIAAGTNLPALAGTVSNGDFGLYVWTVSSAGTVTQQTLVTAASFAAIAWPNLPADQAVLGALLINPTGTGDFVGGTTDIDDATVTPGAVFFQGNSMPSGDRLEFFNGASPAF